MAGTSNQSGAQTSYRQVLSASRAGYTSPKVEKYFGHIATGVAIAGGGYVVITSFPIQALLIASLLHPAGPADEVLESLGRAQVARTAIQLAYQLKQKYFGR